jgi:hypothetical protein
MRTGILVCFCLFLLFVCLFVWADVVGSAVGLLMGLPAIIGFGLWVELVRLSLGVRRGLDRMARNVFGGDLEKYWRVVKECLMIS